jgi:hypothetical protein
MSTLNLEQSARDLGHEMRVRWSLKTRQIGKARRLRDHILAQAGITPSLAVAV